MKLFISYAHTDKWQINQLVEILRDFGHDPWFDNRLMPGQDWKAALTQAVTSCDAFVYALTPEAVASEWCQWEFAKAVELNKPIIPVLVQSKTIIPNALSKYQYADFSEGPTVKAVAKLSGGLMNIAVTIPFDTTLVIAIDPKGVPAHAE